MGEITFSVEVLNIESTYGVSLELIEGDEASPNYFMVFNGPPAQDIQEIANIFGSVHQEAMDKVGLKGQVTEEEFADKFHQSLEVAGTLMANYGFKPVNPQEMDQDLFEALLRASDEDDTIDPKLLN